MGTFQPTPLCELVITSEGTWVLKAVVWQAGAQSLPCPGGAQSPLSPGRTVHVPQGWQRQGRQQSPPCCR